MAIQIIYRDRDDVVREQKERAAQEAYDSETEKLREQLRIAQQELADAEARLTTETV